MTEDQLETARSLSQFLGFKFEATFVRSLVEGIDELSASLERSRVVAQRIKAHLEVEQAKLVSRREDLKKKLEVMHERLESAGKVVRALGLCLEDLRWPLMQCLTNAEVGNRCREVITAEVVDALEICLPTPSTGSIGRDWIRVNAARMKDLEEQIPHIVQSTADGLYLRRRDTGKGFGARLCDGRCFVARSLLTESP